MEYFLENDAATVALGQLLGQVTSNDTTIYLLGDLGAGKTTLTRGFMSAKGHTGVVKSPTYTLVEPYKFASVTVYHFDLYRLNDPEELEMMGIRDYFSSDSIRIVEWPYNGRGVLPEPDVTVALEYVGVNRKATLQAVSRKGNTILEAVMKSEDNPFNS